MTSTVIKQSGMLRHPSIATGESMAHEPVHSSDLLSPQEVAEALGVKVQTVHAWKFRKLMPPPNMIISGCPMWRRQAIAVWAAQTRRLSPASSLWQEARFIPVAS